MIHAASMGAPSWAENLALLLDHYRIYSVDNIGEGNKSELYDPLRYPKNQQEIAEHARQAAEEYPQIRIEVLESGHLIATEKADFINRVLVDFLALDGLEFYLKVV